MAYAGTSLVTTAPDPTMAWSPIVTPGVMTTFAPSHTSLPIITFSFVWPCSAIGQEAVVLSQPTPNYGAETGGVFEGPSHAEGGLNVTDNKTGKPVVNVEGGEPFMVLSKETRRNNGQLINQLLFNSMHRNGATVDTGAVHAGIQQARNPGYNNAAFANSQQAHAGGSSAAPGRAQGADNGQMMKETNDLLRGLHSKFDDFANKPQEFNNRAFENYTTLIAATRSASNATG